MTVSSHINRSGFAVCFILATTVIAPTLFGGVKPPPPPPDDLTAPHSWTPTPSKLHNYFNLGPTGMFGIFSAKNHSGQVFVDQVSPDSPAHGKIVRGDVLLGVAGKRFEKGDNLIVVIGNAINEAEKDENGGKLTFTVWHDDNWAKRVSRGEINVASISVDDILKDIDANSDAFSDFRTKEQQEAHLKAQQKGEIDAAFKEFPIKATVKEITLNLDVLGTFSETSPWDCPKAAKIRENAWKVLEAKYHTMRRPGIYAAAGRFAVAGMALLASGKPEHLEMLKKNLHKIPSLMEGRHVGKKGWWQHWHYGSWHGGYTTTFLAEYYLRTGDKKILPGLRQWALATAKAQTGGGTWGHSSSRTNQNFGKYGGPAPGYGAMNQAAGPCFYGLTLAVKAGIDDPIVVNAVKRSVKFYSAYCDKGGVPYGVHGPVLYEDSNGKSGPPALAMRMAGEPYKANYYALCSAVGSSWGYRGGHADGTFGNYWIQLASGLAGKDAVAMWMKKLHPYYTMLRRHDGSFVSIRFGGAGGIGSQFDPTAMYAMHYSMPLAKTYTTGRAPDSRIVATKRDLMHLKDRIDGTWRSATTDELISKMDTFSPELRRDTRKGYPSELKKRYEAGEKDMVQKLLKQLDHDSPRMREGALSVLASLGKEASGKALPRAVEMLNDPAEVVRIAAVHLIKANNTTLSEGRKPKVISADISKEASELFKTALTHFENDTMDHLNTPNALQGLMINTPNEFAKAPYDQGYRQEDVTRVLETFLTLDPRQSVMSGPKSYWERDTVIKAAGPLMFTAENFPLNGIMFGGSAPSGAKALLAKHGFIEALEASFAESHKLTSVPVGIQGYLQPTNLGWFDPPLVLKYKGAAKPYLPWLRKVLILRPNVSQGYVVGRQKKSYPLYKALKLIENDNDPEHLSSLRKIAIATFNRDVDALGDDSAKIAFCQKVLEPERKTYYRQIGAMTRLLELRGADAVSDLGPYLIHDHWRFSDHSQKLLIESKADGTVSALIKLTENDDPAIAAGALTVLGKRGDRGALKKALAILGSTKEPVVLGGAAQAVYGCSNGEHVDILLKSLNTVGDDYESEKAVYGFEKAFLLGKDSEALKEKTAVALRKTATDAPAHIKRMLFFVLGQYGGTENLSYLKSKAGSDDLQEFEDAVEAISWSPDISATQVILDVLKTYAKTPRAQIISKHGVKRMINGGKVLASVPDDVNLDYAQEHLKYVRNIEMLRFMGNIHRGRCLQLLYKYMQLGPEKVTATAAQSIIGASGGMSPKLPLNERKAAAKVLTQVVEYINVVHTRKDVEDVGFKEAAGYYMWKGIADKAGITLKRIYDPSEEALDVDTGIGEEDLDL